MAIFPRFMPTSYNQAIKPTTQVQASGINPAFPLSWMRDAMPTKRVRFPSGFNIYAGFNDKIDYLNNVGTPRVITIPPGNYASGTLLAAAVLARLNATDAYTWTVAYTVGNVFQITSSVTVTWKFGTGANVATSAAIDMGLGVLDTGAVLNISGATNSYHSREFLNFTFPAAIGATVGIVHGINLLAGGTATLYAKASATPWVTPAITQVLGGDDPLNKRIAFFNFAGYTYWSMVFDDHANPAAYTEIGVPYIGQYWQPASKYEYELESQSVSRSALRIADQGALYYTQKQSPQRRRLIFRPLSRADRDTYIGIENEHAHLFLAFDPVNYPGTETLYGVIPSPAVIPAHKSVPTTYDASVSFMEQLG